MLHPWSSGPFGDVKAGAITLAEVLADAQARPSASSSTPADSLELPSRKLPSTLTVSPPLQVVRPLAAPLDNQKTIPYHPDLPTHRATTFPARLSSNRPTQAVATSANTRDDSCLNLYSLADWFSS